MTVVGGGLGGALRDPITYGVIAGLVAGKFIGVLAGTYVTARFTRADLDESLAWIDVCAVALLTGIGFTVSLLVGELAFGAGHERDDHVKVGVLAGSLLAALLAGVLLRRRNAHYREVEKRETADEDGDGTPDLYQQA